MHTEVQSRPVLSETELLKLVRSGYGRSGKGGRSRLPLAQTSSFGEAVLQPGVEIYYPPRKDHSGRSATNAIIYVGDWGGSVIRIKGDTVTVTMRNADGSAPSQRGAARSSSIRGAILA